MSHEVKAEAGAASSLRQETAKGRCNASGLRLYRRRSFRRARSLHNMAFWGLEVQPGKMAPYVPPPESARLRLSNVCLDDTNIQGEAKAVLSCKGEDDQRFCLCSLRAPSRESTTVDLMFDGYTEFSVTGTAAVHLTGRPLRPRPAGVILRAGRGR